MSCATSRERCIGAALFERNNLAVTMAPIGKPLFTDLLPMCRSLHEGSERAIRTVGGETRSEISPACRLRISIPAHRVGPLPRCASHLHQQTVASGPWADSEVRPGPYARPRAPTSGLDQIRIDHLAETRHRNNLQNHHGRPGNNVSDQQRNAAGAIGRRSRTRRLFGGGIAL